MKPEINQKICRIALFMIWLIVLMPIYSANALEIQFNPDTGVEVSDNSAKIRWSTDVQSTGRVRYGIADTGEFKPSTTPGTEHSIDITGISAETTFRFFIEAENGTAVARLPAAGDYFTFTTEPPRDRTPPHAVKNLAAPTVTRDTISLSWAPDDRDADIDHYVVSRNGQVISDTVSQTSFTDTGLNFSTEYIYVVFAVDTSGNPGPGVTLKVTTRAETYQPVFISNFKADVLGTNIYLTWDTNIESHTRVRYSTNPLLLDQKKEDATLTTKHNLTLIDLQPNTDYTLMAESCDLTANCGNSSPITVRTTEKIELMLAVDGMDCSLDTITYSNTNRFNVKGRSSPGADVNAYVNGQRQRFKRITSTGEFNFQGLDLDPNKAENEVKITASDQISPDKVCIEKVRLDYFTPEVRFSNETENLSFSDQQSARIRGSVFDEHKVTLYAYVQSVDDTTAPPAPENLTAQSMQANSITIKWDPFDVYVTDVSKYFIYRSDVPDGPIDSKDAGVTEYTDDKVSTSTTYTYQVSAVDKAGNEGQKSAPFSVTTLGNGTIVPPRTKITPPNPGLKLTKEYVTANTTIEFTESVGPLFDGQNLVRLEFVDEAGNAFEKQFNIYYDREPPTFLSPTAADFQTLYSPAYVSEILVTGQINKPAGRILVWVNRPLTEEPTDKFDVGENGTFEAEISLITTIGSGIGSVFEGDVGTGEIEVREAGGIAGPASPEGGKPNRVILVAEDAFGRRSQPVEGVILYNPCGQEFYWSIEPQYGGSILNTRELLEGIAAYGFGFKLKWVGGGDASKARAQRVTVTKATVSVRQQDDYDFDWLKGQPRVLCKDRTNCTEGFVMIDFLTLDPPGDTFFEKEQNLSNHRKGECWPHLGCIHLLLEMEIVSDPAPLMAVYSGSERGIPPVGTQPIREQRQCFDIKVQLDERVDPSIIPKEALESLINFTDGVIDFTETVIEKPLAVIAKVTLGLCLLGYLSKFFMDLFYVKMQCKWGPSVAQLSGKNIAGAIRSAFSKGEIESIAKMHDGTDKGACYVEFPEKLDNSNRPGNKEAREACTQCADAIDTAKYVTSAWHMFCDRIMCPTVPSLQHYIHSKWKGKRATTLGELGVTAATAAVRTLGDQLASGDCNKGASGKKRYPTAADISLYICREGGSVWADAGRIPVTNAIIEEGGRYWITDEKGVAKQPKYDSLEAAQAAYKTSGQQPAPAQAAAGDVPQALKQYGCTIKLADTAQLIYPNQGNIYLYNCGGTELNRWADAQGNLVAKAVIKEGTRYYVVGADGTRLVNPQPVSQQDTKQFADEPSAMAFYNIQFLTGAAVTGMQTAEEQAGAAGAAGLLAEQGLAGDELEQGFDLGEPSRQATNIVGGTNDKPPVGERDYDTVYTYSQMQSMVQGGAHLYTLYKDIKSDCQFAEMGPVPVKQMYDFYMSEDANVKEMQEMCMKGHVPQAACCPFEYMETWQWGMPFSTEIEESYCLAHPEDEENCGAFQEIIHGVTGICQPEAEHPTAMPVVLNGLLWGTSRGAGVQTNNVMYLVELDEDGSFKSVKRGYTAVEVKGIVGTPEQTGRVEIRTGEYFVPDSKELASFFPGRNNADVSLDEIKYKDGLKQFGNDLMPFIQKDDIVLRGGKTEKDRLVTDIARSGGTYVGTKVEEWYRQIYNILGEPGQQYIAWPQSSIIQSAITLCLSALLQWIVNFKNILLQFRDCMESILITGDGQAGVCQNLVSHYICDLLYEGISCIVQRFGGGSAQARVGFSGSFGAFFSSVGDVSRGITEEAQARYGDRNLFATAFSAENVLHDACMAAFYGEWPTDLGEVFESAIYQPLNSTAWISPPTRAWRAYDPATGYSRYVYKVAYVIFANADIQFNMNLVCSGQGEYCEAGENGVCDCGHPGGAQRILQMPRHGTGNCPEGGVLRKGERCSDEVLFVVEGRPGAVRYDKVELNWFTVAPTGISPGTTGRTGGFMGTVPQPEQLAGAVDATIREISGPTPGLCSFVLGEFKCGFEIPLQGIARFFGDPVMKRPTGQYYGIGDKLIADIQIEQALPPDTESCGAQDCETTKYLVIKEITNHLGAKVYPKPGAREVGERLNRDGYHLFTLFDAQQFPQHNARHGEFVITQDMFAMRPSTEAAQALLGTLRGYIIGAVQPIEITPPFYVKVYYNPGAGDVNARWTYVSGSYNKLTNEFKADDSTQKTCAVKSVPGQDNYEVTCGGFRLMADNAKLSNDKTDDNIKNKKIMDMVLAYEQTAGVAGIAACPEEPKTWNILLEIRNADTSLGGVQMSSQPAFDPETAKKLELKIPFQAVCRQTGAYARPDTGVLSDLSAITATVTNDNDQYNQSFGLWVDRNSMGAPATGDSVRVGNFRWLENNRHQNGFALSIATSAAYASLHMDIASLNLELNNLQIKKENIMDPLKDCTLVSNLPPCIKSRSSASDVWILLRKGDPEFTFTGFTEKAAAPPATADVSAAKNAEFFPCGTGGTCMKKASCSDTSEITGAGECQDGLMCCKTPKQSIIENNPCGPAMGFAGIPTCLKDCSKGVKYEDGTAFCGQGTSCYVSKIQCAEEDDPALNALLKDEKISAKLKITDAKGNIFTKSCEPSKICLPGYTDNPALLDVLGYGECTDLNFPPLLAKYCPKMSDSTCKATSGIAKQFLDACKAQNLAAACTS